MKDWLKNWFTKISQKIIKANQNIESYISSDKSKKFRITYSVIWNLLLVFSLLLITGMVFFISIGAGYFASLVKDEPLWSKEEMQKLVYNYEETSELYFANNIYIGKVRTDLERRETSLENVSPTAIEAVLATEDEFFQEHNGIVPKAILRGLLQDFTNSSSQTGGSTLTQQLIKNQVLTNEVSYERKARELLLAMRLEKFMTKDEILEAYLNIIPYGRNASGRNIAGIETAAQGIFGVSASELTLPQAAYIAGIPQAPYSYTPFTQKGELKDEQGLQPGLNRMKTVLYRMKEVGYITEEEYNEAIYYDITKDFREPEQQAINSYPWLTFELENRAKRIIADILAEKDGIDPKRLEEEDKLLEKYMILADRDLRSNGYRIYSTIDRDLYNKMNEAAQNFEDYGYTLTRTVTNPETGEQETIQMPVQIGTELIENKTGKILSFVGGRDFEIKQLNYATQAYRQNGSTMKPLLAYGPAIEYGIIGAGSPVVDVKFTRSWDGYSPSNFIANEEKGIIPAREALATSQNLTALRLYNSILDRNPATFLEKMGFTKLTKDDHESLSAAIGALTYGTTVEENTNAYTTFANGGQFIDGYMIEKIEDLDGNIIYEHKAEPVQVFSPETAYMITDMLRDVLKYGTGTRARSALKFSSDFAAKTGTTQDFKDVWFVGYNPNVTLGVWMGYDQPQSLNRFNGKYGQPSTRVNLLWATLMNAAYDVKPELIDTDETFQRPKNVVTMSFCGLSGLAPSDACQKAGFVRSDLFNKNVFVPSKADDSFITASTVTIDGKQYLALDSTPKEFINEGGLGLNPDFAKRMLGKLGGDVTKLLPSSNNKIITTEKFEPEDGAPKEVTSSLQGNVISWTKSSSKDVIGYRVYSITDGSRTLINTLKDGIQNVTLPGNGNYIIVAVDITGIESNDSNVITIGTETPPAKDGQNQHQNGEDNDNENDGNSNNEDNDNEDNENQSDENPNENQNNEDSSEHTEQESNED